VLWHRTSEGLTSYLKCGVMSDMMRGPMQLAQVQQLAVAVVVRRYRCTWG
jgi:hypothetical protein